MALKQDPTPPRSGLLAFALILGHCTASAEDQLTELTRTVYLVEVASYCSLVDEAVAEGFRQEHDRIVARDEIGQPGIEKARMEAWKMAHAEWQNRGLGGFRNWCRTEGMEAAGFFRDIAADPR